MSLRGCFSVCLCALTIGAAAWGDESKSYVGTFKDGDGHSGPLTCELISKGEGKWTATLSGNNTGSGPNRPYKYTGEFTGKADGANMALTGNVVLQRQGPYVITAVLSDNALKATFKKKSGGGDGSFDLTLAKGNAPAAPAESKPGTPAPTPKAEDQKPK